MFPISIQRAVGGPHSLNVIFCSVSSWQPSCILGRFCSTQDFAFCWAPGSSMKANVAMNPRKDAAMSSDGSEN